MSRSRLYSVLANIHRPRSCSEAESVPDAELLDRFARLRDEAAIELLVWRHERMVLGVCRRLLRDEQDAEDAFQAVFLTLARKAASIGRREAVASWLYKVAYRCALRVRKSVRRQRQGVVNGIDSANVAVSDSSLTAIEQDDLRALLDEEVQRLPTKYRTAIVLCYLEGKSYQQAALELGCPAGTLSARLHTAREKLRRRLTARGIAPAAALAVLEGASEAHAAARLAAVAVQAAGRIISGQSAADVVSSRALEICTGVIQAMSVSKPKIVAIVLLIGCLSGLTGWTVRRAISVSAETLAPRLVDVSAADAKLEPQPKKSKKEKEDKSLGSILRKWAEADAKIREMHVRFTMTNIDPTFDVKTVTKGQASIKKPDLWRIDRRDKEGRIQDILLLETKRLYWFNAEAKTERVVLVSEVLNKDLKIAFWDNPMLWIVSRLLRGDGLEMIRWHFFGPQARDLDSRYEIRIDNEDQWYIYLDITPKKERTVFDRGRIVLLRKNYQVRQVWFEHANRSETVVDFLDRRPNEKEPITRQSLMKGLPKKG